MSQASPTIAEPSTRPAANPEAALALLTDSQRALFERGARGDAPRALALSRARIDVGLWLRWRRIWVAGFDDRLMVFAEGPRPYLQSAPYAELSTSFYSHASGELVCVPADGLVVRSFGMSPAQGWRFLTLIRRGNGTA